MQYWISTKVSDVPRGLHSWVSTIQTVVLTADVFELFIKYHSHGVWSMSSATEHCLRMQDIEASTFHNTPLQGKLPGEHTISPSVLSLLLWTLSWMAWSAAFGWGLAWQEKRGASEMIELSRLRARTAQKNAGWFTFLKPYFEAA